MLRTAIVSYASLLLVSISFHAGCGGSDTTSDPDASTSGTDSGADGNGSGTLRSWSLGSGSTTIRYSEGEDEVFSESLGGQGRGIAYAFGSAWTLVDQKTLVRYDTATRKRVASIDLGATKGAFIAASGAAVWVGIDDVPTPCSTDTATPRLKRIDPATNQVIATINVKSCDRYEGLVANGTAVFGLLSNDFKIFSVIEAGGLLTEKRVAPAGEGAFGTGKLALCGTNLWLRDNTRKTIQRVDVATLNFTASTSVVEAWNDEATCTDSALYYRSSSTLVRLDGSDLTKRVSVEEGPERIQVLNGALYILGEATGGTLSAIAELDPATLVRKREFTFSSMDDMVVF